MTQTFDFSEAQALRMVDDVRRVRGLLGEALSRNPGLALLAVKPELERLCAAIEGRFPMARTPAESQVQSRTEFESELDDLMSAVGRNAVTHARYQGRAMPDDVYNEFASNRDVRIPQHKRRLLAVFRDEDIEGVSCALKQEAATELMTRLLVCESRCCVLKNATDDAVCANKEALLSDLVHVTVPRLRKQLLDAAEVSLLARRRC